ncbi:MAG: hypothetical protein IPF54_26505 [Draconibacterium sp.]|nr:hypothetical protein [Draconibacterium sp.]
MNGKFVSRTAQGKMQNGGRNSVEWFNPVIDRNAPVLANQIANSLPLGRVGVGLLISKIMAASYTRRINLYINGKQVFADLVSIRREMSKLVNEQARMTIGSKEYVKHTAKIKSLKTIIDQHNQDLSTTHKKWNSFQKMADAANRYFAVITAGIAAVAGAVMTVKQTVEAFAEYDDKLVDVMKTTDLTKMDTKELNEEIRKIDTRTAQLELLELARVAGKLGIRGKKIFSVS